MRLHYREASGACSFPEAKRLGLFPKFVVHFFGGSSSKFHVGILLFMETTIWKFNDARFVGQNTTRGGKKQTSIGHGANHLGLKRSAAGGGQLKVRRPTQASVMTCKSPLENPEQGSKKMISKPELTMPSSLNLASKIVISTP